jgi:hypothetical protein
MFTIVLLEVVADLATVRGVDGANAVVEMRMVARIAAM